MIDPDHARDLLRQELANPEYAPQRNWLQEAKDWFINHVLDPILRHANSAPGIVMTILLVLLVIAVGYSLTRFRARRAAPSVAEDLVFTDATATAAQLRTSAAEAAARGDYTRAYLDYFRALARSGQERALVPADPGLTAHELGRPLAGCFPAESGEIERAASGFDLFRYGEVPASEADVNRIRGLDERLRAARPVVVA
ncbi:uncharacterized protein DUF4129 [Branchiibius hedensis]|uniref:Protein-glutamine gamma-glutamyltransferase-like C-terminal domain-containing protein n=1 Tax=Branchiibius hedensis TaxID=672460 RepID=A0A2Y8ZXB5_9MICO|nr:DUF4129 domain-containing protein [Branchiibius hedensis]PWJ26097.1 uncharacterized protein DUF4129 [Branchiibius hedensis]SSA34909.1 protein of unknown function [Branchiibius hedensis]